MAGNKTQPGTRVSKELWDRFREDVAKRRGSTHGHLGTELENALRSYLEGSRGGDLTDEVRRIREDVDEIMAAIDSQSAVERETHSVSKTTENRVSNIMGDIRDRADQLDTVRVTDDDVEAAIERHAGTTYKTINRYKELLQNQQELFAHPSEEGVFFAWPGAFIAAIEQDERISRNQVDKVRTDYGEDWWLNNAPDGMFNDDTQLGFQ